MSSSVKSKQPRESTSSCSSSKEDSGSDEKRDNATSIDCDLVSTTSVATDNLFNHNNNGGAVSSATTWTSVIIEKCPPRIAEWSSKSRDLNEFEKLIENRINGGGNGSGGGDGNIPATMIATDDSARLKHITIIENVDSCAITTTTITNTTTTTTQGGGNRSMLIDKHRDQSRGN